MYIVSNRCIFFKYSLRLELKKLLSYKMYIKHVVKMSGNSWNKFNTIGSRRYILHKHLVNPSSGFPLTRRRWMTFSLNSSSYNKFSFFVNHSHLFKLQRSKLFSSVTNDVEEISIPVPYGHIAGKVEIQYVCAIFSHALCVKTKQNFLISSVLRFTLKCVCALKLLIDSNQIIHTSLVR